MHLVRGIEQREIVIARTLSGVEGDVAISRVFLPSWGIPMPVCALARNDRRYKKASRLNRRLGLLHKLIDGLAQIVDRVGVAGADGIHNAVAHMILQDYLAGIVQSAADGGQLD